MPLDGCTSPSSLLNSLFRAFCQTRTRCERAREFGRSVFQKGIGRDRGDEGDKNRHGPNSSCEAFWAMVSRGWDESNCRLKSWAVFPANPRITDFFKSAEERRFDFAILGLFSAPPRRAFPAGCRHARSFLGGKAHPAEDMNGPPRDLVAEPPRTSAAPAAKP